ncbi:MAG: hypothetical protein H7Z21_05200 [Hymenobacter sp.]|nr:hypothetical protein [Hymenobacter sp.]
MMKLRHRTTAALGSLLLTAASALAGHGQSFTLAGQLVDRDRGTKMSGLTVEIKYRSANGRRPDLAPADDAQVTHDALDASDSDGHFTFRFAGEQELRNIRQFVFSVQGGDWEIVDPVRGVSDLNLLHDGGGKPYFEQKILVCISKKRRENQREARLEAIIRELTDQLAAKEQRKSELLSQQLAAQQAFAQASSSHQRTSVEYQEVLKARNKQIRDSLQQTAADLNRLDSFIRQNVKANLLVGFDKYLDDLRNLNQFLRKDKIRDAFLYEQTREQLFGLVTAYNESRVGLVKNKTSYLGDVNKYWGPECRNMLDAIYVASMTRINEEVLANKFNAEVLNQISLAVKQEKPRLVAQRHAVKSAVLIQGELTRELAALTQAMGALQARLVDSGIQKH